MNNWALSDIERRLANLIRYGVVEDLDDEANLIRVRFGDNVTTWIHWLTRRAGPDSDWWAPEPGEQVLVFSPSGETAQAVAMPAINQTAHPAAGDRRTLRRVTFADGAVMEYDRAASVHRATYPDGTVIHYDAINSVHRADYADGSSIEFDGATSDLTATILNDITAIAGGNMNLDVGANLDATVDGSATVDIGSTLTANVATSANLTCPETTINGNVTINGFLTLAGGMSFAPGAGGSGGSLEGDFSLVGTMTVNGDVVVDGISSKGHTHNENGTGGGVTDPPN